jgi:hypothetical protein
MAGFLSVSEVEKSNLAMRQFRCQPGERGRPSISAFETSKIDNRNLTDVPFNSYSPSWATRQPQTSFVEVCRGVPLTPIVVIRQSSSAQRSMEEITCPYPDDAATNLAASPKVVVYPDSDSSADNSDGTGLPESAENSNSAFVQSVSYFLLFSRFIMTDGGKKSQTLLSNDSEQEVDISWRGIIEAPSAVDAQQAFLNFAGVAAAILSTAHGSEGCSGNVTLGEEIKVRTAWFDQEADLRRVENECLILCDIVQNNRVQRIKRRAFDHQISTQTLRGKELQTGQAVSGLHGQLNVCECPVASTEAEELELLLQEQNLETETKVRGGNRQLITNVNNWSINESQACPLLRNNALDCDKHQNQTFLLDKCKS